MGIMRYDHREVLQGNYSSVLDHEWPNVLEDSARVTAEAARRVAGKRGQRRQLPPDTISLAEAARILGKSTRTLKNWIQAGQFTAEHGLTRFGPGRTPHHVNKTTLLAEIAKGNGSLHLASRSEHLKKA